MLEEKVKKAQDALKLAAKMSKEFYHAPLIICYSGGKDSDVLLDLALRCLNPDEFMVENSHTSVDAPQTVYHIRDVFEKVEHEGVETEVIIPRYKDGKRKTMWNLIPKKSMPPTRFQRYCCKELKETTTPNRIVATGVRADESAGRKGRDIFAIRANKKKDAKFFSLEHSQEVFEESKDRDPIWDCTLIKREREQGNVVVNAIYEFTEADIWNYINKFNVNVCNLYGCGYKRIGCIGCPLGGYTAQIKEFNDFPKYKDAYIRAFDQMIELRKQNGKGVNRKWNTGYECFVWWIQDPAFPNQMDFTFDEDGNVSYVEHKNIYKSGQ